MPRIQHRPIRSRHASGTGRAVSITRSAVADCASTVNRQHIRSRFERATTLRWPHGLRAQSERLRVSSATAHDTPAVSCWSPARGKGQLPPRQGWRLNSLSGYATLSGTPPIVIRLSPLSRLCTPSQATSVPPMLHMTRYLSHAASKQETLTGYSPRLSCETLQSSRAPVSLRCRASIAPSHVARRSTGRHT